MFTFASLFAEPVCQTFIQLGILRAVATRRRSLRCHFQLAREQNILFLTPFLTMNSEIPYFPIVIYGFGLRNDFQLEVEIVRTIWYMN